MLKLNKSVRVQVMKSTFLSAHKLKRELFRFMALFRADLTESGPELQNISYGTLYEQSSSELYGCFWWIKKREKVHWVEIESID